MYSDRNNNRHTIQLAPTIEAALPAGALGRLLARPSQPHPLLKPSRHAARPVVVPFRPLAETRRHLRAQLEEKIGEAAARQAALVLSLDAARARRTAGRRAIGQLLMAAGAVALALAVCGIAALRAF